MAFKALQIIEPILRALKDEGYSIPTPIQAEAIPIVLAGHDLLGVAQTGTGKTAAFAIPIIQLLSEDARQDGVKHREDGPKDGVKGGLKHRQKRRPIRALVLTPTRELAVQIEDSFKAYGRHAHLNTTVVFGGVGQHPQTTALHRGVDIVIATPGRLLDLMEQGHVDLQSVEMFVLDEADRMLDMGFLNDVKRILHALPKSRQSLFFSATMPPAIVRLAHDILDNPKRVEITPAEATVDLIEQELYYVDKAQKLALLLELLETKDIKNALVFTRTKHGADAVVKGLQRNNISSEAIHGNKAQNARQRALNNFKQQRTRVLVATDIAARGIDVDELEHVINFEIPNVPETYVHRIGRTGRAGSSGTAYSFCMPEEKSYLRDIEKLIKRRIPVITDHPFAKAPRQDMKLTQRKDSDGSQSESRSSRGHSREDGVSHAKPHRKPDHGASRSSAPVLKKRSDDERPTHSSTPREESRSREDGPPRGRSRDDFGSDDRRSAPRSPRGPRGDASKPAEARTRGPRGPRKDSSSRGTHSPAELHSRPRPRAEHAEPRQKSESHAASSGPKSAKPREKKRWPSSKKRARKG